MDEVRPPELDEKKVVATWPPYFTTWCLVAATAASDAATCRSTGQYIWLRVSAKASKVPPAVAAAEERAPPACPGPAGASRAAGPSRAPPPLTYRSTPTTPTSDSAPPLRAMRK